MTRLIGILFVGIFAFAYMIFTHYLAPLLIGNVVNELNYGLIIGALFWIVFILSKGEKK